MFSKQMCLKVFSNNVIAPRSAGSPIHKRGPATLKDFPLRHPPYCRSREAQSIEF